MTDTTEATDQKPFRVGDGVRLNSGGPDMLIVDVGEQYLWCVWHTDRTIILGPPDDNCTMSPNSITSRAKFHSLRLTPRRVQVYLSSSSPRGLLGIGGGASWLDILRGRSQYGFLLIGQTRGCHVALRGTHLCPHRSHR